MTEIIRDAITEICEFAPIIPLVILSIGKWNRYSENDIFPKNSSIIIFGRKILNDKNTEIADKSEIINLYGFSL